MGKLSITFFLLLCVRAVIAQSTIGLPAIRNYKNTDYQGANAVWDIVQDARGILYFGNDDGLLTYDGHYWKRYTLPNKAAIKSVAIDRKGRIFVGGQDELGYFQPDRQGALRFFSLKTLLPDVARQFADIWDIVVTGDTVVFRTNECIFRYDGTHMRTYDAPAGWRLLVSAGGRLFADDKEQGLREWRNGIWAPACGNMPTMDLRVTGVTPFRGDTLLVSTLRRGLFLLNGSVLTNWPAQLPAGSQIGSAHRISQDRYALGTRTGGVYIVDGKGTLIQQFSTSEGLQSNHVLAVLEDRDHHLWFGLESGVSFIDYPTALTHIYPSGDHQVLSNAVAILDGVMYIGTSNGLYSALLDGGGKDFSLVPGTQGQVWTLEVIDGTLFMGHQDGMFVIRNGQAQPISTAQGAWGVIKGPGNTLVSGTYTGLRFVLNKQGRLVDGGRVTDYYESLSVLAADNQGNVWAAHPHRGLYRTPVPGDSTYYYNHLDGLPSDLDNYPYKIRGRVVFATAKGIYAFDGRRFHPDTAFARLFGDTSVEFLTEELSTGDIWFISRQQVGVTDGKRTVYFPELNGQTVRGAGYIYPYDRENIFVGTNNGIIHLDYGRYVQADTGVQVLLSAVYAVATRDSLVFGGYPVAGKTPHFPNRWNSFHFEYASPLYAQDNSVVYSYYLEGFDKTWSEWSSKPEKEYTNLPYGAYTFWVKARNNLGNTSAPAAYTFVVEPAWYQTWWAYTVYLLAASALVGLIVRRQRRRFELHQQRHEAEQERLRYLHRLELDSKEKSKLEAELATVTMHLVERGGLLSNIKEEMISVIKRLNIPHLPYEFRSVFKLMTDTGKEEDDWNRFSLYFDQVHNNFLTTLKTRFPSLSPTDLKMCAYLRLNLSSKEIAQLLNISPKGVEISRYRIRKKLGLTPEVNLFDFLTDMGA